MRGRQREQDANGRRGYAKRRRERVRDHNAERVRRAHRTPIGWYSFLEAVRKRKAKRAKA